LESSAFYGQKRDRWTALPYVKRGIMVIMKNEERVKTAL
jgi:hypothetical protein